MAKSNQCPICQSKVAAGDKYFPFCSRRCELVDLGKWLDGEYSIPAEESEEDS